MAQRGYPGDSARRVYAGGYRAGSKEPKPCAPYCTIFCVHRVALLDRISVNPREALVQLFPAGQAGEARPAAAGAGADPDVCACAAVAGRGAAEEGCAEGAEYSVIELR